MNETPPPFFVCAITSFGRRRERAQVVPVAARDRPSERATLRLQVADVADLVYPGVRLDQVPVDDHRDLVQAAVGGRLQRLPELPLLKLTVAGEDVRPARAAGEAVGEREP